ncbi:PREDICTED: uncharacterized protein LOC109231617 [Nicotiana attenuata]|uniref:uncharacterized protein LOC109231617 n=1 Tax=Nicotiana attenuata TaxID=49451 RepID=UPI000905C65C|nr:PREDICTED: uncharacterized protein LOC109231617 [Nicotiana attenuata]
MTTVRGLIAVAVKRGWNMFKLDVNNAFLDGDLNEEVFMEVPPRQVVSEPRLVFRLYKSLFGLKQANIQWYAKLIEALCSKGYEQSMHDYSLLYKKNGTSFVYVAIYVDDVILTGTDLEEIKLLKKFLHDSFKIKDLGRLQYFLGLEILYKDDEVIISQRKFVIDLLKEYNCLSCSSLSSPLDPNVKLKANEGAHLSVPSCYRKLVGKLNFLTNTRLDIAFSVQHLRQFMQDPREPHLKAAYHLLRYLKADPSLEVFFSKNDDYTVRAYCDSDWASCPDSRKSVTGYVVLLGDSPISWKSKKRETISLSSAEAEYRSIRKVVGELVWLQRLLEELTISLSSPIAVFCDSQSALHIARNPVFHERTKHIEELLGSCRDWRNQLEGKEARLKEEAINHEDTDGINEGLTKGNK